MRKDVLGTIIIAIYMIIAILIIAVLFIKESLKIAIPITIVFGGIGIWAFVKTLKYWINKFKQHYGIQKENNNLGEQ